MNELSVGTELVPLVPLASPLQLDCKGSSQIRGQSKQLTQLRPHSADTRLLVDLPLRLRAAGTWAH